MDEIDQAFPPRSNLEPDEARALFSSLVINSAACFRNRTDIPSIAQASNQHCSNDRFVEGKDNLLYKLVKLVWLAPMSREEMAEMVRSLGIRMGRPGP